jgi:NAD(P)-dependent dehydrogenase (short-subunit alcohol dehydrogenase family)
MGSELPRTVVVLGARNLGDAITRGLRADGARVATIARTQSSLQPLADAGALAIAADATEPDELASALELVAEELGPPAVIVNAVSTRPPAGGFGGGPLVEATLAAFEAWTVPAARQAFVFFTCAARALADRGGTLIQITGAPARRALRERGLIAAGQSAIRAFAHTAAQELREAGIHVALLIVDGIIESPKTAAMTAGMAPDALVRQQDVVEAVRFLGTQSAHGLTHELVLTPSGGRWLP